MTAAAITLAGQLAVALAKGCTSRRLAAVLTTLHAALCDEVDARITDTLYDCVCALDSLQDELDDEACECPMSPTYSTSIDPPERMIGKNRECPVHGRDPDADRDAQQEAKWDR